VSQNCFHWGKAHLPRFIRVVVMVMVMVVLPLELTFSHNNVPTYRDCSKTRQFSSFSSILPQAWSWRPPLKNQNILCMCVLFYSGIWNQDRKERERHPHPIRSTPPKRSRQTGIGIYRQSPTYKPSFSSNVRCECVLYSHSFTFSIRIQCCLPERDEKSSYPRVPFFFRGDNTVPP
jgi:hypothetical protein